MRIQSEWFEHPALGELELVNKLVIPLLNVLKDSIVNHDITSMDATTGQVLNETNRLSHIYIVLEGEED